MSGQVVAEGVVVVTADAKSVPKDVADDLEKGKGQAAQAGTSLGKSIFGGILGGFALIGGAAAVTSYFTGAITKASDLNETMSKSSVIFGKNAADVSNWGNSAAKNLGLSKSAALDAAASFGDMFSQIGFTGDVAAENSKKVVQMAADLGSFSNLDTADVTERIAGAFRGEYDALQTVIPNISAARVQQEAMAETGKKNANALTAQEKATAVLAIIQKDGKRAMGDFARTSSGAANSQKILTASLDDQQAKLGGVLLPIWRDFLHFLNGSVIPGFAGVVTWVKDNSKFLGSLAMAIGVAAGAFLVLKTGLMAYNAVSGIFKAYQIAAAAATGGLTVAQWLLNAAMDANPIGLIIIALAALVGGIVWVATQTTFFQDVWKNVTTAIGVAWTWLWTNVLQPTFTAIGAVFTWIYQNIIMPIVTGIMIYIGLWAAVIVWLWQTILSPIITAIGVAWNWLYQNVIGPVIGLIMWQIKGMAAVIIWLWQNAVMPAVTGIGVAFRWVWSTIIQPTIGFISGAITNIGNVVRSVFGGIAGFVGAAFQGALMVVRGPINGIIGLVNSAIRGINSLHVTIPDWVPIVGGQTWGLHIPSIPMLARGGTIWKEGSVIVGERGPELLTLPRGATVTPRGSGSSPAPSHGDAPFIGRDLVINEAEDPLGSAGRVGSELRKWGKK